MVIKSAYPTQGEDPVFGQNLTREELAALERKIKAHPARYVAQKQVMSCTTPALIGEDVQPRRFVVRSYLSAYGDSYTVMNGGLSRITQSNDSLVVSLQKGGRSKDTWILSDGPVSPVTLLPVDDPAHCHQPRRQRFAQPPGRRSVLAGALFGAHRCAGTPGARSASRA